MANIASAKKQARQNIKRHAINQARRSAVKTAVKKVLVALEQKQDIATIKELLRQAESQIARAKGKGVLHKNTASRKVSRLAKQVASIERSARA